MKKLIIAFIFASLGSPFIIQGSAYDSFFQDQIIRPLDASYQETVKVISNLNAIPTTEDLVRTMIKHKDRLSKLLPTYLQSLKEYLMTKTVSHRQFQVPLGATQKGMNNLLMVFMQLQNRLADSSAPEGTFNSPRDFADLSVKNFGDAISDYNRNFPKHFASQTYPEPQGSEKKDAHVGKIRSFVNWWIED